MQEYIVDARNRTSAMLLSCIFSERASVMNFSVVLLALAPPSSRNPRKTTVLTCDVVI